MSSQDRAFAEWSRLADEFHAARFRAYVGRNELSFFLQINEGPILAAIAAEKGPDWDVADTGSEYLRRVRSELEPLLAGTKVTLAIEPYGGPKTGGWVPDQQYVIGLVDFLFHGIETVVVLANGIVLLRHLISKAESLTKTNVIVSDGAALILAADAIYTASGDTDLTLAFVSPMTRYQTGMEEGHSSFDGWLIGFRSPDAICMAHVDVYGAVTLVADDIQVSWITPA